MDICRKQGEKRFSFCRDTELEEFKPETDIPPETDKKGHGATEIGSLGTLKMSS